MKSCSSLEFIKDEPGAVTVDFTVLTAGIVGLGVAVAATIVPAMRASLSELAQFLLEVASGVHNILERLGDQVVVTSSGTYNSDLTPEKTMDGDPNTLYHSDVKGGWVNYDLGTEHTISEVIITNHADGTQWTIERLNGAQVVLFDADSNELHRSDPISGVTEGGQVVTMSFDDIEGV